MDDKPLVVAVADEEGLRHYYENVAENAGISCRAFPHAEEVPADLRDARMAILNHRALCNVGLFSGSRVLITGGEVSGDYRDYCVNEVWQNPVSVATLQGLMRKYTSDKPRVLVVEDDPGVDKFLKTALNDMGHHVELFANADEAVPFIPSAHYVLSDITQPKGMGGFGLLDVARQIYDSAQLPFILISGYNLDPQLMPPTAQAFLKKPFAAPALEAVINRVLSQRMGKV